MSTPIRRRNFVVWLHNVWATYPGTHRGAGHYPGSTLLIPALLAATLLFADQMIDILRRGWARTNGAPR